MKESYISAVLDLLQTGVEPDAVLRGLDATLAARGHGALKAGILRGVARHLAAGSGLAPQLSVATAADADVLRDEIVATFNTLGIDTVPAPTTDDSLIGGFIAAAGGRILDRSYKRQLVELYRTLTA